jgi:hypothetical protein
MAKKLFPRPRRGQRLDEFFTVDLIEAVLSKIESNAAGENITAGPGLLRRPQQGGVALMLNKRPAAAGFVNHPWRVTKATTPEAEGEEDEPVAGIKVAPGLISYATALPPPMMGTSFIPKYDGVELSEDGPVIPITETCWVGLRATFTNPTDLSPASVVVETSTVWDLTFKPVARIVVTENEETGAFSSKITQLLFANQGIRGPVLDGYGPYFWGI